MRKQNLMQVPQEQINFRSLRKFFKNWANFSRFWCFPYGIKEFRVSLIEIGSHILLYNTTMHTLKTLDMRKYLQKNKREDANLAIFAFYDFYFHWKISRALPKNPMEIFFPGVGARLNSPFSIILGVASWWASE